MSIHWTLIAGFLYGEIVAVLLLMSPLISPKRWKRMFDSSFMKAIGGQSFFYFCVVILLLVLAFLDAIREMRKYSGDFEGETSSHGHLDVEIQQHMRLFRAQRNFYISGFALFLFLVLRRLVSLLVHQATVEAQSEAAIRQAASASAAATALLEGSAPVPTAGDTADLEKKLEEAERERDQALKKAEMLQCQAEANIREYDRLLGEHATLQKQVERGDKKDD